MKNPFLVLVASLALAFPVCAQTVISPSGGAPTSITNGGGTVSVDGSGNVSMAPASGGQVAVANGDTYVPARIDFSTVGSLTLSASGHASLGYNGTSLQLSLNGGAFSPILTGASSLNPTNLSTGSGAVTIAAGGTNQNITLTPSGTGKVGLGGAPTYSPMELRWGGGTIANKGFLNLIDTANSSSSASNGASISGFGSEIATGSTGRVWYFGPDGGALQLDIFYQQNGPIAFFTNATQKLTLYGSGGLYLGTSPSDPGAGALNINGSILQSDAVNTLAQRNGTNAQLSRIYGSYTDASNNYYLETGQNAGGFGTNYFAISAVANGTGTAKGVGLQAASSTGGVITVGISGQIYFGNKSANWWSFSTSGHFLAATNNTYDIGDSAGLSRPRNGYFGTSLTAPLLTNNITGNGTANTVTTGHTLTDTTAATSGNQIYSPAIVQTGQGWKTTATAASQSVSFRSYVVPVQGSTSPTGTWTLESSVNGGSWGNGLTYDSTGILNLPTSGYVSFGGTLFALSGTATYTTLNSPNTFGQVQFSVNGVQKAFVDYTGIWQFGTTSAGQTWAAKPRTATQITADQNNFNPGGQSYYLRMSSDASRNVTGLTFTNTQIDGQTHVIVNVGSNNIVLANESASSTAANRFHNSTGADITLAPDGEVNAWYDATTARWRVTKRGF